MPDHNMANIAQRMFGAPLMVEPGKAEVIARAFGPRVLGAEPIIIGGTGANADGAIAPRAGSILADPLTEHLTNEKTGYRNYRGVAVIEVIGSLVRRGSWLGQSSGMTSYEGLRAQITAAASDPAIKAIALELDTPGGEAAGAFELADLIREVRQTKPVYAFCAEYAFSAGYALASQANRITVPEFGGAGSIGVIMMHIDQSQHLKQEGLTVTIIRAGEHKAEGNSVEPLPEDLRKAWVQEAEKMRISFAELVGKGRGHRFSMAQALKTEARCFTGPEAVRMGLADQVADPKKAFDAMVASVNETGIWDGSIPDRQSRITLGSPGCATGAQAPHNEEESEMTDKTTKPEAKEAEGTTQAQGNTSANTETREASAPAPQASEDRAAKIVAMVAKAKLPASFASELIASGVTVAEASDKVIDRMAASSADGGEIANGVGRIEVTGDGVDRMRAGMVEALSAKAGLDGGARNEFSSMSLREMARHTITARGLSVPAGGPLQMVGAAFVPSMAGGSHTTSDFGHVLADVANKAMLKGYQEAEETFETFTARGTLMDFKPSKRVGSGLFPGLEEVAEDAEFTYGSMGDFSETMVLATYGRLFKISRQAVINDDLGAFTTIPMKMGRASKRMVGSLVYGVLTGSHVMSDGTELFHANHGNLAASGAAPSEATIDAGLQAMAQQKPRGTDDPDARLNVTPKFLISGYANRSAVLTALMSEKAPSTANNKGTQAYNSVYKAAEPIFDARITGNAWFMAADPAAFDTIEVAYLDGVAEPFIDQQDGWKVDGTEFKVRLDAAVKALAWEGLYKNAGA